MAKKVFTGAPGQSGVGDAVRAWLDRQGIDPAMVVGYSVFQHVGEIPRIMLEMYFDDVPPPVEDVSRETSRPVPDGCNCSFVLCADCPGRLTGDPANCDRISKEG